MKTCLFCQTPVEDNVSHCPACGAAIPSDAAYTSSAPDSPVQTSTPPVQNEVPAGSPIPDAAFIDEQTTFKNSDLTKTAVNEQEVFPDESPAPEQSSETSHAQTEESPQKPHRFKRFFAALATHRRRILSLAIAFVVGIAVGGISFLLISLFGRPPAVTVSALESMADQIAEQYAVLIPEEDSETASISIDNQKRPPSGGLGTVYSYRFILKKQAVSAETLYGTLSAIDCNKDGLMDCITYTFPYSGSPNDEKMQVSYRVFTALVEKLTPFDPHQIWTPGEGEPNWDIGKAADDSTDTNSSRSIRLTTDFYYFSMHPDYENDVSISANLYLNPQVMFTSGWLY